VNHPSDPSSHGKVLEQIASEFSRSVREKTGATRTFFLAPSEAPQRKGYIFWDSQGHQADA
jgi:hypothetical protein